MEGDVELEDFERVEGGRETDGLEYALGSLREYIIKVNFKRRY